MSVEFCPKCGSPLETAADPGRLCEACGWFGDWQEVLHSPPPQDKFNPVLTAVQSLALYRYVCREELLAEQANGSSLDLRKVQASVRSAGRSMVETFTNLRVYQDRQPMILPRAGNGLVAWPSDWTDYHHNASHEPCDMLVGPCSCGAWHKETEEWVRATLTRHHAVIQ
jgi:hypothetical protein